MGLRVKNEEVGKVDLFRLLDHYGDLKVDLGIIWLFPFWGLILR